VCPGDDTQVQGGRLEKALGPVVCGDQPLDFPEQIVVTAARGVQKRGPFVRVVFEHGFVELANLPVSLGRHARVASAFIGGNRWENGSICTAMAADPPTITVLLTRWRAGDERAGAELMTVVYAELRRLAASYMRHERSEHTLAPTGLVHEAYLRLCGGAEIDWQSRGHFFAVFAQQMRRVLVDHARSVQSAKRGGGLHKHSLTGVEPGDPRLESIDLLAVNEALERLAALDPRAAQVVELRYFGGLTEREAADALQVSTATIKRDWDFARTWLSSQLQ